MATYLGAFPFPSQAPAILSLEALLKVVTILTERYSAVLKKRGRELWLREIYRSLAVYDRGARASIESRKDKENEESEDKYTKSSSTSNQGFAVDMPEEGGEGDDEDDELVLAALDSMDAIEVFKHGEQTNVHHSIIPTDNLLKLIELLLLIAPIDPQQSISSFAPQLSDARVEEIRRTGSYIMSSFGVEDIPGVTFRTYISVISSCLPYLFEGLHPLFEHFLFAKDFDLSKRNPDAVSPTVETHPVIPPPKAVTNSQPVLPETEGGEILNLTTLSQLSFFIKGTELFRRLRLLYNGNTHGFSMGSFSKQAFHWRAPTILLVSGTLLPANPHTARERTLSDMLPPKRLPSSIPDSEAESTTLTFGAYIPAQWKQTHKSCFSDSGTILFQLSPVHDVFPASELVNDYAYFNRAPTTPSGVGFGTPIKEHSAAHSTHSSHSPFRPGPVSLHLDDALEFGVFTHHSEGGGSFHPSRLPSRKGKDWQDRFEIERLEVWGCGGDEVAEAQRREWAFQEREAEARRRINLGTGDKDADRELLRLAGIIGGERSGGSV
jgi:hypothetical protein